MVPPAHNNRILIVDDHPIVLYGLRFLLDGSRDFTICGEANSVASLHEQISALNPDILILDLLLGGHDGIDLIRAALRQSPDLRIIVYSCEHEHVAGPRALRAGARGYVSKVGGLPQIQEALDTISRGDLFFGGQSRSSGDFATMSNERRALDTLSNREMQVLQMTGQGMTLQRIAQELDLSTKTIGTYRERLKIKLGVDRVQELVWLSQDLGARNLIEAWSRGR